MTRRNTTRKIGLAVGSLILSLAAAEVVARQVYEPVLTFENFVRWQDQEFVPPLNKLGFREEPVLGVPKAARRVLMLGDSFTWGHGLYDAQDRFSDLVEARFNNEANDVDIHVYNAAVPATNPTQWSRYVTRILPIYDARCVFAIFFLRDGTKLATSIKFHSDKIAEIRKRHHSALYDASYLVRTLVDHSIAREFSEWYQGEFRKAYLGNRKETRMWRSAQVHLRKIRNECARRDIPFHLVVFPLLLDLDDYGFGDVEAEIKRFADEDEIPFFSLTPGFVGLRAEDLWVSASNQHPNAEGHRIAADTLYPYFFEAVSSAR